jgi:hypothetical protein
MPPPTPAAFPPGTGKHLPAPRPAAAAEPGVAEVWANAERLSLEGDRATIELLASKQPLATEVISAK